MKRLWMLVAVAIALASAAPALAAAPPPAPAAATATTHPVPGGEPDDAVTHHTIVLNGQTYAYTARAGTITLRNNLEQPTVAIFYVAYTLDGAAPNTRPVTFFYNGGPGSSTMWLHMGSFGPERVQAGDGTLTGPPPYTYGPNPNSLLDKTDLVFIDMPGSGFGRILAAGSPKMFYGLDADVAAFGQFIQRYVTSFDRWNSPKFLYGESYGTTRSAALSWWLAQHMVALNGVVLQSSILNFGVDYTDFAPFGGDDWGYVLYLPTQAATAWYHNAIPNKPADLTAYLKEVRQFAIGEYNDCLAKGAQCPTSEVNDVVARLHKYLGISEKYIRNANLRVPYTGTMTQMLRDRDILVGRLDSRYSTYNLDGVGQNPVWDTTDAAIDAPYTTAVNDYIRNDLDYKTTLQYRGEIYDQIYANGGSWDFKHNGLSIADVTPDLAQAMTYNPSLKIFSANGYYDFATPFFETEYTLAHLGINPALQSNITYGYYQSGHMIYLNPDSLKQLHDDLSRWYDATLGGH